MKSLNILQENATRLRCTRMLILEEGTMVLDTNMMSIAEHWTISEPFEEKLIPEIKPATNFFGAKFDDKKSSSIQIEIKSRY